MTVVYAHVSVLLILVYFEPQLSPKSGLLMKYKLQFSPMPYNVIRLPSEAIEAAGDEMKVPMSSSLHNDQLSPWLKLKVTFILLFMPLANTAQCFPSGLHTTAGAE